MMPKPAVLKQTPNSSGLKDGFDRLAELLAVTLGPSRGIVVSTSRDKPNPELLNDAATIARRMLALPDPAQNVGAMLLRNLVWRVHQQVGDGGAITAVLAQALLEHSSRVVHAGANAALVQRGMRIGVNAAVKALQAQARPISGEDEYVAVAQAVTGEPELSVILGELYEILGPLAYITIEDYEAPYLERVYLEGGQWQARIASPYFVSTTASRRAVLRAPRVVLFDGDVKSIEQVQPLLELIAAQNDSALLLVAHKVSGEALNALVVNHQQTQRSIAAAGLLRVGDKLRADFVDLAVLTGAQIISPQMGRRLQSVEAGDLGRARRAEVSADQLFLVGGHADGRLVRRQIETIQSRLEALPFDDDQRPEYQMRLGRLAGSSAILKLGALSKAERSILHQKAEQGLKAVRAALEEGVVPGGGAAYLHSLTAVLASQEGLADEECMGVQAVYRSLQAPFRRILQNAYIEVPGVVMADLLHAEAGTVFDVIGKALRPAGEAGVLDPVKVLRIALETAASGAAMGLSTGTVVLHRRPHVSLEP